MRICRYLCLLFLFFLYNTLFFAAYYLLNLPPSGLQIMAITLCAIIIGVSLLGDRLILAMTRAKRVSQRQFQEDWYRDEVDNFRCLLGLPQIEIYRSGDLPPNIYVLQGLRQSAYIVFGGDLAGHLSKKEIQALIYFSALKIKNFNLRFVQICNFLFFMINLPAIFVGHFRCLKYLHTTIGFFLLPLESFKAFVFEKESKRLAELMEKVEIEDMGNTVKTVYFKLQHFSRDRRQEIDKLLLAHLSGLPAGLPAGLSENL